MSWVSHVEVTVQGVGDGRGGAGEREAFSTNAHMSEKSLSEKRAARQLKLKYVYKDSPPVCGDDFDKMGEAWLAAQEPPADVEPAVLKLVDEWFGPPKAAGGGVVKKVSEEALKAKQEEARRKSLAQQQKEQESARHWRSLRPRPVDVVPWATVERTKWCSGGMGGATLMQVGSDECVVVKTLGLNAVAEVLAVEVAKLIGVRVADSRPLAADAVRCAQGGAETMAPEFSEMVEAMGRAQMEGATVELMKSRTSLADFVVVMEFASGAVLQGVEGMQTLQGELAPSVLHQLGSLIALDCVLNNVDRVPAIWLNDGNLSNVMVTADGVVGIDQQVNAIGDASGRARYLKSLAEFCGESAQGGVAAASAKRIATAILENCGVELGDVSLKMVLEGAAAVFRRIKEDEASLSTALKALDGKMRGIFGRSSVDVGLSQLEKMTDFLVECVGTVASAS